MNTAELIAQTEAMENVRANFQELWRNQLLPRIQGLSKDKPDLHLLSDIAWAAYRAATKATINAPSYRSEKV
jgi:hypothetical protein